MGEAATQNVKAEQFASPARVNAKQHNRIVKRRLARQKLDDTITIASKLRTLVPSCTTSTHSRDFDLCLRQRPRGPDGRFLTPDQLAAQALEKLSIQAVGENSAQRPSVDPHAIICENPERSKL